MPRSHIPRDGGPRQPESSPLSGGPGTEDAAAPAAASAKASRRTRRPAWAAEPALRRAAWLQAGAALLWLPQAWLLARALGTLVAGGTGVAAVATEAGLVLLLGLVRAVLDIYGGRLAFRSARDRLGRDRARAVAALAGLPPLDPGRPAAGAAAALVTEQAEAVLAYWHRFRPAKLRVVLVGPFILLAVGWVSWLAALLLLLTAPLIFLFMALIGWRAKAASEARLAEVADMHGLLLDRLRGLPTIRALGAVEAAALRLRSLSDTVRRRTMAVRIAFLSSTVLELFSALGVAMVAVYVGFHLLGELTSAPGAGRSGWSRGCSSCCWPRPGSSRCANWRRSGTTAPRARPPWRPCRSWGTGPSPDRRPRPTPPVRRRPPAWPASRRRWRSARCASPIPVASAPSSTGSTLPWRPASGSPCWGRAAAASPPCWP
ncbi:ABC transporter transmembrane domain-containing protein [Rhodospirillum centenum]|uniref:ABC transporter transmembrane domain-containing protein n=1 Tax=Rhodospirillum centenum TaxID=34018 RepID=UPI0002EF8E67|nr:ABC transporter transmembrane domain-containing protein [Rhodospirillum centenum]